MISAHGDTPLHDDPAFLGLLATVGSPLALISFGWYWVRHRRRD